MGIIRKTIKDNPLIIFIMVLLTTMILVDAFYLHLLSKSNYFWFGFTIGGCFYLLITMIANRIVSSGRDDRFEFKTLKIIESEEHYKEYWNFRAELSNCKAIDYKNLIAMLTLLIEKWEIENKK